MLFPSNFDPRFIRWAPVNLVSPRIGPKESAVRPVTHSWMDQVIYIRIMGTAGIIEESRCPTWHGFIHSSCIVSPVRHERIVVVIGIHGPTKKKLADVITTIGSLRFELRFCQCRQKHPSEDRNNGDHHQQFDQSEGMCMSSPREGSIGKAWVWISLHMVSLRDLFYTYTY